MKATIALLLHLYIGPLQYQVLKPKRRILDMKATPIRKGRKKSEMSQATILEDMKAKAEVYYGDEICREKFKHLLTEIGFPDGLVIILREIEEYGYVKDTGFVWLKHKKKNEEEKKKNKREYFKYDNIFIWHDTEVTAYFEPNKIKNLTGVEAKGFLIWITLTEIYVNSPSSSMITFRTQAGLSKSFPLSVFEIGNTALMVQTPEPGGDR